MVKMHTESVSHEWTAPKSEVGQAFDGLSGEGLQLKRNFTNGAISNLEGAPLLVCRLRGAKPGQDYAPGISTPPSAEAAVRVRNSEKLKLPDQRFAAF